MLRQIGYNTFPYLSGEETLDTKHGGVTFQKPHDQHMIQHLQRGLQNTLTTCMNSVSACVF